MNVLILFEFSGALRQAFMRHGHHAVSVDLREGEGEGEHIVGDAYQYGMLNGSNFDLIIAHPPCTYLTNAGVRWLKGNPERWRQMERATTQFTWLQMLECPHIAIENPVMHGHARKRIYDWPVCTTQPWQFGHLEKKRTCWWLKNLPPLEPVTDLLQETNALPMKEQQRVFYMSPGPEREKERSRTLEGVANAIADQWGRYVELQSTIDH